MSAIEVPSLLGGDGLFDAYAILRDEKAAGTGGGSSTSGSWQTRTLNTEVDPDGIVSLSANQFTLAPGSYFIRSRAVAFEMNGPHKTRIRNITDGTTALVGTSEYLSGVSVATESSAEGRITLTASKTFELQHRVATSRATVGYGPESNWGEVEVYATVEIWREGQSVLASRIGVTDAAGNFAGVDLESVLAELQANYEAHVGDFTNAFLLGGM